MKAELGSAVIANAASVSGAIDLTSLQLTGVIVPSAWTTANLTLQASPDGVTYSDVYDDAGVEAKITVIAGSYVGFRNDLETLVRGARFLKLRSGTTGTPVNQGAARTITLITEQRT